MTSLPEKFNEHKEHALFSSTASSLDLPALAEKPWHEKIIGMTVSMDVSTGDEDAQDRVFGTIYEVMLETGGADENTILAIEDGRNFTDKPITTTTTTAKLTKAIAKDHEIRELVGRLTKVATEFHGADQLRERIAQEICAFDLIRKTP